MNLLFKLSLSVAFVLHGLWNLSDRGLQWWSMQIPFMAKEVSTAVGPIEILLAITLWIPRLERYSLAAIFVIMVGACLITAPHGYLYKNGGCEVPVLYCLIAAHLWRKPKHGPIL